MTNAERQATAGRIDRIGGHDLFHVTLGAGRPVLVLHGGLGLDHTYLRPWLDPLADQAELTYFDFSGNGRSERIDLSATGHDHWVAEIDALREFLGHERITLLGHSYGGYLAQEYALRHPERLSGLVLVNTAPVLDHGDVILANARRRATPEQLRVVEQDLFRPLGSDEEWREVWRTVLPLYFHRYDPAIGAALDREMHYSVEAFNVGFSRNLQTYDVREGLWHVAVPALVTGGADDWILPPAQGAFRIAERLRRGRLEIFRHSGHFPFIEEQARFLEVVRAWLEETG